MLAISSLFLALQAAAPSAEYLEISRAIARDTVVSGFCYSLGWEPEPTANNGFEAEIDRLAASHQVLPGLARETLLRQALEVSSNLRAELTPPTDPTQQIAFFDSLEARAARDCPDVATRRPELFKGSIDVNHARMRANFVELRRQIQAQTGTPPR